MSYSTLTEYAGNPMFVSYEFESPSINNASPIVVNNSLIVGIFHIVLSNTESVARFVTCVATPASTFSTITSNGPNDSGVQKHKRSYV